jgi:hypothetical protein
VDSKGGHLVVETLQGNLVAVSGVSHFFIFLPVSFPSFLQKHADDGSGRKMTGDSILSIGHPLVDLWRCQTASGRRRWQTSLRQRAVRPSKWKVLIVIIHIGPCPMGKIPTRRQNTITVVRIVTYISCYASFAMGV